MTVIWRFAAAAAISSLLTVSFSVGQVPPSGEFDAQVGHRYSKLNIFNRWIVSNDVSECDGAPKVLFTLIGTPVGHRCPILLLSYARDEWSAMVYTSPGATSKTMRVALQWDVGGMQPQLWHCSRNRAGAFPPNPKEFVQRILRSTMLHLAFGSDSMDHRDDAQFDVSGLKQEIAMFPALEQSLKPPELKRNLAGSD